MAVKQISITTGGKIRRYQALTTDAAELYPSASDCGPGSTMDIIDGVNHKVVGQKVFDGSTWNDKEYVIDGGSAV